MFQGLRQNALFYILEKGERPVLRIGQVQTVSNPTPKFGGSGTTYQALTPYGATQEMVVDVTVKVGEEGTPLNFNQLPAQQSIVTFEKQGIIVSDSREAMLAEVEAMQRQSRQTLDSMEYHQGVLSACDEMLLSLNPQFAKEREQQEKIALLEENMTGMKSTLGQIQNMLAEALNRGGSGSSSRKGGSANRDE